MAAWHCPDDIVVSMRKMMVAPRGWGLFLESPENFSGPKRQLLNSNPLWKANLFRESKRAMKFDGLEPRRCEDIKKIVAPEIGPKSFETFEKQAAGVRWFFFFAQKVRPY